MITKNMRLPIKTSYRINDLIHESNKQHIKKNTLKDMPSLPIRAGLSGGLPFDSLTTDVVSGCLPCRSACYGNCFSAKHYFENGFNFGGRIRNILEEKLLQEDFSNLPKSQKNTRVGWHSDPSWAWDLAIEVSRIASDAGILPIFISKIFTSPSHNYMKKLSRYRTEIRVSISAIDNLQQLKKRLKFCLDYREAGGIAIPIIMTACYSNTKIMKKQDSIVEWVSKNKIIGSENSLRFQDSSPMINIINRDKTKYIKDSENIWSGRLYEKQLIFPTTTSIPASYQGISSGFIESIDKNYLRSISADPVKVHSEVMDSSIDLSPPKQCGVVERIQ